MCKVNSQEKRTQNLSTFRKGYQQDTYIGDILTNHSHIWLICDRLIGHLCYVTQLQKKTRTKDIVDDP